MKLIITIALGAAFLCGCGKGEQKPKKEAAPAADVSTGGATEATPVTGAPATPTNPTGTGTTTGDTPGNPTAPTTLEDEPSDGSTDEGTDEE